MKLVIRTIETKDYKSAHAFQCEYLDHEGFEAFINRVEENPDLYIAAFDEEALIGICYGHPSARLESFVNLQGIAVNLDTRKDYARKGIGSQLIKIFEEAVATKGYLKIGLGSADDERVESFYLKNGFKPCELVAKGPNHEEYERISITDYESGKVVQQELRCRYNSKEVIFIFEKSVL